MRKAKKITPQYEKRAKKFHELWEKGFSVMEAAEKMGISWRTIYKELQMYAEINGVPKKENPNRLYYIRDYKARAKGLFVDRVIREEPKSEPETAKEVAVEETVTASNTIGIEAVNNVFDDAANMCAYLAEFMEGKINEYTTRLNNI